MDKGSISHMDTLSPWQGDTVTWLNFVIHPYDLYITLGHSGPNKYGYSVDKNIDMILKWHGDKEASLNIWYITNNHSL